MIRVKESMKTFCNSQLELCDKTRIAFTAGSELIEQIPELTPHSLDDDILNMTYQGKARTLQIVFNAKDALQKKREDSPQQPSSVSGSAPQPIPTSPPSYEEIHRQYPINPYFHASPETIFNTSNGGGIRRFNSTDL